MMMVRDETPCSSLVFSGFYASGADAVVGLVVESMTECILMIVTL